MKRSSTTEPFVELRNYSLWSGSQWVLRNVSLSVAPGSFCVLLGANGAGKSSLLRALSGVLQSPWEEYGHLQACMGGVTSRDISHRSQTLSWLPQCLHFSDDMSVREFLWLRGGEAGFSAGSNQRVLAAAEEFGVQSLFDQRLSALSGGQWQRVRLARSLGRDAQLFLLDEPDTALDAAWRRVLWHALSQRQSRGATLILALHRFGEIREFASAWFGLENGALVFAENGRDVFPWACVERLFLDKDLTR